MTKNTCIFTSFNYKFFPRLFCLVKNEWTLLKIQGHAPCPRRRQCCCVLGDKVFLFGGTRYVVGIITLGVCHIPQSIAVKVSTTLFNEHSVPILARKNNQITWKFAPDIDCVIMGYIKCQWIITGFYMRHISIIWQSFMRILGNPQLSCQFYIIMMYSQAWFHIYGESPMSQV